jgi:hypothetical protein
VGKRPVVRFCEPSGHDSRKHPDNLRNGHVFIRNPTEFDDSGEVTYSGRQTPYKRETAFKM